MVSRDGFYIFGPVQFTGQFIRLQLCDFCSRLLDTGFRPEFFFLQIRNYFTLRTICRFVFQILAVLRTDCLQVIFVRPVIADWLNNAIKGKSLNLTDADAKKVS